MKKKLQNWPSLFFTLLLVGCRVGPVYEAPEVAVPEQWQSETPASFTTDSVEDLIWWKCLQDPLLDELMHYASTQNLDLKIAALRILQARSEAKAKKGDLYPHIDGSLNYGHVYASRDALVHGLLENAERRKSIKRNTNFYEVGFDADWELDFFGLKTHEIAALQAQEEAVEEALCGVWVTLSAEIAKNYVQLRELQTRLAIAKEAIQNQEESLQLTLALLARGLNHEADSSAARAEWSTLKAELAPLEGNIIRTIHRLAILIGYQPGDLMACLSPLAPLPHLPDTLSIGIPSELLRRRPDIRKAERELAAATEKIGSAIAELFPRFSLRGFVGDISTHAGKLFSPAAATWFAGPQILVPIFNSRLILQGVEYNKMLAQESLYNYQKIVLQALEEAENAIASFRYEEERLNHLREAFQQNQNALIFATQLHSQGLDDSFSLSKAKKALAIAKDGMVRSQAELIIQYIALYKALGGSWDPDFAIEE